MSPVTVRPANMFCRAARLISALAFGLWATVGAVNAQSTLYQEQDRDTDRPYNGNGASGSRGEGSAPQGPLRLRQPGDRGIEGDRGERYGRPGRGEGFERGSRYDDLSYEEELFEQQRLERLRNPPRPGEFVLYARRLAGQAAEDDERSASLLRRFGADLVTAAGYPQASERGGNPLVPADYVVGPGDEIQLLLWGSVDAELRLQVDRSGRIGIPRVGSITVAGVRYADLADVIRQRVAKVFRNFDLSISLGQLRGVRVYVTGFAAYPGAYNMTSLTTIVGALMRAGGPAAAGSFRDIQLKRGKDVVARFDLYDLMLRGDKSADQPVRADDVIHVGPVGMQVALIGSVNKPAVFELKAGDTVEDVLEMAGGFTAVADRSRLGLERLEQRSSAGITELSLPTASAEAPLNGDVLRAFSAVDAVLPVALQNRRVLVEGEVRRPGEYVLPPESSIADALRAAGGLTDAAYVFGSEFSRESVRQTQQENYERALRDLETDFAKATTTQRAYTSDDAATQAAQATANTRLIERLRSLKPTGRVVLQLSPDAADLPDLALEDGDRIYVPARPTTVGVFGSVFNSGSYLYNRGEEVNDFIGLAGGPTRGADSGSTFVLRANGSVISARQRSNWLGFGANVDRVDALAGDTVFVPEEINKTRWTQELREWSQIFYQFGLGAAAIRTLQN